MGSAGSLPDTSKDVFEAIHSLRGTRKYEDRAIPAEHLDRILRAATMAASSGNTQPWEFVLLRDPESKRTIKSWVQKSFAELDQNDRAETPEQLVDGAGRPVTGHASIEAIDVVPVIVVVFWNPDRGIRLKNQYAENQDGTLRPIGGDRDSRGASLYPACQNMMLAAWALGVSSLFSTSFRLCEPEIKRLLNVPPRMFLEAAIFLGYSAEKLGHPRRRPLSEVVHVDVWDDYYQPQD